MRAMGGPQRPACGHMWPPARRVLGGANMERTWSVWLRPGRVPHRQGGHLCHAEQPAVQDVLLPLRECDDGVRQAHRLRPRAAGGDRQQGLRSGLRGGGLHHCQLAGAGIPREGPRQPVVAKCIPCSLLGAVRTTA
eukprot:3891030-Pyramimonas_sp.AAC.1